VGVGEDAMRWTPETGPRAELDQCDESCHEFGYDECTRCDTLLWDLMCDSCRWYAMQDGGAA
jgi:hypothetical protein